MRTFGDFIRWAWQLGRVLGKREDETVLDAARRVVAERDAARLELRALQAVAPMGARR